MTTPTTPTTPADILLFLVLVQTILLLIIAGLLASRSTRGR